MKLIVPALVLALCGVAHAQHHVVAHSADAPDSPGSTRTPTPNPKPSRSATPYLPDVTPDATPTPMPNEPYEVDDVQLTPDEYNEICMRAAQDAVRIKEIAESSYDCYYCGKTVGSAAIIVASPFVPELGYLVPPALDGAKDLANDPASVAEDCAACADAVYDSARDAYQSAIRSLKSHDTEYREPSPRPNPSPKVQSNDDDANTYSEPEPSPEPERSPRDGTVHIPSAANYY